MSDVETERRPVVSIVVAAGNGVRMAGSVPKALRHAAGVPLVTRAVENLAAGGVDVAVVVVAAGLEQDFAEVLSGVSIPCLFVAGGAERQDSVANGLALLESHAAISDTNIVLVHDAARAFAPPHLIRRVIDAILAGAEAVAPAIGVADSVRQVSGSGSAVVDRSVLRLVQTPQGFRREVLHAAHERLGYTHKHVTDDASAAEAAGHRVTLVDGAREAFKITEAFDLAVAEALVARAELV
ncbi:MAG: 2-C-methyl-D-erythritol 4-phosphate cytidylyltransferase [Propioniciclava sp.]